MLEVASTEIDDLVTALSDAGMASELRRDAHSRVERLSAELEAQRVDRSTPIRLSCLSDWSTAVEDEQQYACALASQSLRQALDCLGVGAVPSLHRALDQAAGLH